MLEFILRPSPYQRRLGQSLLLLALLVISYLVFSRPGYGQPFSHFDKLGHFGAFFCLAALLQWATNAPPWRQLLWLGGYALMIEVIQSRLPYRHGDMIDMAADMIGASTFYLCLWGLRRWQGR
ncbi:VanZ family protein [Ferrimonas gelatinilytica]|uniref:VanZ family protein n=1 Tax=Ferrimonas gelatinilytica TaxID=1255257 RepID=A0ABP9S4E9_9GAMM